MGRRVDYGLCSGKVRKGGMVDGKIGRETIEKISGKKG